MMVGAQKPVLIPFITEYSAKEASCTMCIHFWYVTPGIKHATFCNASGCNIIEIKLENVLVFFFVCFFKKSALLLDEPVKLFELLYCVDTQHVISTKSQFVSYLQATCQLTGILSSNRPLVVTGHFEVSRHFSTQYRIRGQFCHKDIGNFR